MAVKRIKELKNIDAFDSFSWLGNELKKYNLIYGWNGSGKTTLSRLFNFLERKTIHIKDLSSIEFAIQDDSGVIKQNNLPNHGLNIRVFNEDFIEENLLFKESHANKIVILGKENVDIKKEIDELSTDYQIKQKSIDELESDKGKLPDIDDVLTDAGREVPKQFANTPLANHKYYGRSYNRTKVEKHLENGKVTEGNLQSLIIEDPNDIDAKREVIKNEKIKIELTVPKISDLSELFASANGLLDTHINVEEIETLKTDKPLRDWVEEGYKLHKERALKSCQFCQNTLPDKLLLQLGSFFTDELQKAKKQIDDTVASIENGGHISVLKLESSSLFPEPAKDYTASKNNFETQTKIIEQRIGELVAELKNKKDALHDHEKKHKAIEYPSDIIEKANEELSKIEKIISEHNKRVDTITDEVQKAAESIELHIIASALLNNRYFPNKKEFDRLTAEIDKLQKEKANLAIEIQTKKGSLHNASDAIEKINNILKEFFGPSHIYLEMTESDDGEISYILKRRGKDAKHLSEGEESVLALVYFLVKLEEDGADKQNALIVIDDPVDSQDSIFLFRTAGLIKRQLTDVGQLIVMSHNFEFFNLIRDWFLSRQLRQESALFLITHNRDTGVQKVTVENLPEILNNYKSEYQYLFCRLYQFAKGIKDLDEPLVANIARKVLEYFASFKWSCRTTEEFSNIVLNRFVADPREIRKGTGDFVVKFLHEYSHGQDFSRSISASSMEARPIAENVLKFIELADIEHYEDLEKLCDPQPKLGEGVQTTDEKTVLETPAT